MSGSVTVSPSGHDGFWSRVWQPGIKGVLVFLGLAVSGFLIWRGDPGGLVLDGIGMDSMHPAHFYLYMLIEPSIRSALALVAGLLFPRGFYLWGLAIVLHTPLSHVIIARWQIEAGYEPFVGGTAGMLNYLFVESVLTVFLMLVYTGFAALGVFMRYLYVKRTRQ